MRVLVHDTLAREDYAWQPPVPAVILYRAQGYAREDVVVDLDGGPAYTRTVVHMRRLEPLDEDAAAFLAAIRLEKPDDLSGFFVSTTALGK